MTHEQEQKLFKDVSDIKEALVGDEYGNNGVIRKLKAHDTILDDYKTNKKIFKFITSVFVALAGGIELVIHYFFGGHK